MARNRAAAPGPVRLGRRGHPPTAGRSAPDARRSPGARRFWLVRGLRVLAAACLAVDAYVHADLAANYDLNAAALSQGDLFRIEAGLACLAALLVLVLGRRPGFGFAFLVAVGGLAAVMLYRYVDVGRLGPLPNMYEPVWFPEKTVSAVAEGAAAFLAACGFAAEWVTARARRRRSATA
jgi:hypothetical protein